MSVLHAKTQQAMPVEAFASAALAWMTVRTERKNRKQNADRRNAVFCRALLAWPRPPMREAHIYQRSTAVLAKGTRSRPRLSLRPCFLGRGLSVEWALPIPACPEVQRCTSRPGPSAEGLMPKAARERVANPRAAPPSPCNPACIRAASDEARFEPICN